MCCLLQTAVGGGHGAGLESAEARRGAVPGCAAGLHCPHQLLLRLHSGSHSGALSCLCHTPRSKVNTCTDTLAFIALYHYRTITMFCSFSLSRVLSAFILVILSPACTLLFSVFFFQELQDMPVSFQDGWLLYLSVISQGILDHSLYGSLVYPLIALLVYPCWLLFWNILFWK